MRWLLEDLSARAITGTIILVGIACWSFLLTGGWPPEYIIIAASLGTAMSPLFWGLVRKIREGPASPGDEEAPGD